ncbi:MAG: Uma2 family endonuclease, partial [Anaerolineae bacterium]|nr:Uma2 family endonuclease [Anaerolineae bacterium]
VEQARLRLKLAQYLAAGVVVWVVDPSARTVEVYAPGAVPQLLTPADTLTGEPVLPGLRLPVQDIFPAQGPGATPA